MVDAVCNLIRTSSDSLKSILARGIDIDGKHYGLPTKTAFLLWMQTAEDNRTQDEEAEGKVLISDQYAHAREAQSDLMHDDLLYVVNKVGEPLLDDNGDAVIGADGLPVKVQTRESIALATLD